MSSPYVSPLLPPQPLEVRSRNIDRQFIPAAIAIIMLALVALPISLPFLLFPGPYTVVGLLLLATLGFLTWFVIWRYRNVTAVRTVVDGRGLWLQQMKFLSFGRCVKNVCNINSILSFGKLVVNTLTHKIRIELNIITHAVLMTALSMILISSSKPSYNCFLLFIRCQFHLAELQFYLRFIFLTGKEKQT